VTLLSADSNDYRDISIQIYVTNLTPITFIVFRLWIARSQPIESTLNVLCDRIGNCLHWNWQHFGTVL